MLQNENGRDLSLNSNGEFRWRKIIDAVINKTYVVAYTGYGSSVPFVGHLNGIPLEDYFRTLVNVDCKFPVGITGGESTLASWLINRLLQSSGADRTKLVSLLTILVNEKHASLNSSDQASLNFMCINLEKPQVASALSVSSPLGEEEDGFTVVHYPDILCTSSLSHQECDVGTSAVTHLKLSNATAILLEEQQQGGVASAHGR
jgi:hypothetical protein